MNRNMELLIEQRSIANQKCFGRSSEKLEIDGQLSMNDCFPGLVTCQQNGGKLIRSSDRQKWRPLFCQGTGYGAFTICLRKTLI